MHGLTDYGDSVEDEWLIIYLLRELSRSFPQLWVRALDEDGEFLLVEAARVLPRWLNPEIDRNRVWINQGKLYIIPKTADELYQSPSITIPNALDFIKRKQMDLVHSSFIEKEAFYRLEKYPDQVAQSLHYSMITLPRKLCYLLHELPTAIAPAIEAFYLRDAFSLKSLYSKTETRTFPPDDFVTASIQFSRILFAQLTSQRFEPPEEWVSAISKQLGLGVGQGDHESKRLNIGMMLTCGFEILARHSTISESRTVREFELLVQDFDEDGISVLPSNEEIASWENANRDDSEEWMNINYEDLERELQGGNSEKNASAFGDPKTQADLRTIVSRFEAFLNDDSAGVDGAEMDEMDLNNDSDSDRENENDLDDDSGEENEDIQLNEGEFSRMLMDMMGMGDSPSKGKGKGKASIPSSVLPKSSNEEEEDDQAIRELSSQFEKELNEHGALRLDRPNNAQIDKLPKNSASKSDAIEEDLDDEEGEVNIDYNLAKNILESFKSQAGMPGPTGNLLSLMGIQLPRDEEDQGIQNAN